MLVLFDLQEDPKSIIFKALFFGFLKTMLSGCFECKNPGQNTAYTTNMSVTTQLQILGNNMRTFKSR